MKKILCMLLASVSVVAFASVGDSSTSEQKIKFYYSATKNVCNSNDYRFHVVLKFDGKVISDDYSAIIDGPYGCSSTKKGQFAWYGMPVDIIYEKDTDEDGKLDAKIYIDTAKVDNNTAKYYITDVSNNKSHILSHPVSCRIIPGPANLDYTNAQLTIDCQSK